MAALSKSPVASVVALGTLAILIMIVLAAAYIVSLRTKALRHAEQETASMSRLIAEQTERSLQGADLVLQGIQERLHEVERRKIGLDELPVHILLKSRLSGMQHVTAFFVVDRDGRVINSSRYFPPFGKSVPDREYFVFHQKNPTQQVHLSDPVQGRSDGVWTMHMSRRLERSDGSFRGVVVASLNLDYFDQLYASIKLDYISPISLYLADGSLVAREPADKTMVGKQFELPPLNGAKTPDTVRRVHTGGSQPETTTYRDVPNFPMTIAISNPESAALASWRGNSLQVAFGTLLAAAFVALVTVLLVRELKREQALAATLADTGETLQALVNSAMDAIVTIDEQQRIVLFNPAAGKMFGCSTRDVLGATLDRFVPEPITNQSREILGVHIDGHEFPIESSISRVQVGSQTLVMAVLRDISDRRVNENALRASHAQLRELSESLLTVREEEQKRIARELHDELGQQLMRLRLDVSWLSGRLKTNPDDLYAKTLDIKDRISEAVAAVRRITTELRPPLLDDLGLSEAAQWLVDDFTKRSGLRIANRIEPVDAFCNAHTANALFRILQEALTNVSRHAQASWVGITLRMDDEHVLLEVEDNGTGIAEIQPAAPRHQGNGLIGIRERVLMLNGTLEIAAGAEGGTRITVQVPRCRDVQEDGERE